MLAFQRRVMGEDFLLAEAATQFSEKQVDGDACSLENRFPAEDVDPLLDMVFPIQFALGSFTEGCLESVLRWMGDTLAIWYCLTGCRGCFP